MHESEIDKPSLNNRREVKKKCKYEKLMGRTTRELGLQAIRVIRKDVSWIKLALCRTHWQKMMAYRTCRLCVEQLNKCLTKRVRVKVKFVLEQATKIQIGSRGIALLFL